MKPLFLTTAAFAALMMIAPIGKAHASTYLHCDDGFHQLRGKAGSNPPVSATVARQDDGRWSVVYVLRYGQAVMRENQYNIADKGNGVGWTGWRDGKQMRASIEHYNGRLAYAEAVYSGGEKLVASNYIDCGVAPADEPPVTAAPDPNDPCPTQWTCHIPSIKQDPPPVATAPAPTPRHDDDNYVATAPVTVATTARILPITMDHDRATAAILVRSTPVTMLIDTGANEMSVTEAVANTLIANHEAVEDQPSHITFADGSTKDERTIKINTVTVAGRQVHGVYAGVTPNNASMLLSLDVLNQVGSKFSIDRAKSEMAFE